MAEKLLTIEETAQYLDIHPGTLYRWAQERRVPAAKVGRCWRFKKEKLDEWVEKHTEVR